MKFDKSNALLERALKAIPTGSQTFSKSHLVFPKGCSPFFFDRGEGARVWDVDGNTFLDYMSALLPVVLGYADPDVNQAISTQLEKGIIFSGSTQLEVELAEKLIDLIPSAEMVRFAKSGTDVTSAAIRVARAHTGREGVLLCGYHGWQDWSIGTTSRNLGVPKAVQALSRTFNYNDIESLESALKADSNVAAIILEPVTMQPPQEGFLQKVRDCADEFGCVLIFDEIVTGFRSDLGGAQKKYGVTPDLSTFGKAMANGMPLSTLVGKEKIMSLFENVFFSGTFGGETLSMAAAIATLDKLKRENAVSRFYKTGGALASEIKKLLTEHTLDSVYEVFGESWRPGVRVRPDAPIDGLVANTLLRQSLIEIGIFQGNVMHITLAHTEPEIEKETLQAWAKVCRALQEATSASDPSSFLKGPVMQPIFQVRK